MLPTGAAPVVFFLVKLAAYAAYCRSAAPSWKKAAALAGGRLAAGAVVGLGLTWALHALHPGGAGNRVGIPPLVGGSWVATYAVVYGLTRLALWRATAAYARARRPWVWATGGAALSFATDALGLLAAVTAVGGIC